MEAQYILMFGAIKKSTLLYIMAAAVIFLYGFAHLTPLEKDCSEQLLDKYLDFRDALIQDEINVETPLMDLRTEKRLAAIQVPLNDESTVANYFVDLFKLLQMVNLKIKTISAYSGQCNLSQETGLLLLKVEFNRVSQPFTRFLVEFNWVDNDWKILSMHPESQQREIELDAGHTFRPLVMSFETVYISSLSTAF